MRKKTMNKNKVNKESQNVQTARDKGVNSTDLLGYIYGFDKFPLKLLA